MRCRGRGPVPSRYMGVGEKPGWEEAKRGIPLVGKTGDVVRNFMDGIDLPDFEEVYWTNLYREYYGKDYEYTQSDFDADFPELLAEFRRVRPELVIALGREASRAFLGDVDMDEVSALPWKATFDGRDIVVFPIVHPAAGFRNPDVQKDVAYGFHQLGVYLQGGIEPGVPFDDPFAGREDYGEMSGADVMGFQSPAIDTEGWARLPYSLQASDRPGFGRMARLGDGEAMRLFLERWRDEGWRVTYHSGLHDLDIVQRLARETGVDFDPATLPFDDTMAMAYLLQVEPKGLKSLGVRFNGMRMDSFESLIAEPSRRMALDYIRTLYDLENWDWRARNNDEGLRLLDEGKRIRTLPETKKTRLHAATIRILRAADPRALWGKQAEDIQAAGYKRIKLMPEATLDDVKRDVGTTYGCRDSDCTVRLKPQLLTRVRAMGLEEAYQNELGTYPLLLRMMQIGMKPDLRHFEDVAFMLDKELARLQLQLAAESGIADLNANSGDQIAAYLFDKLGIPCDKMTPSKSRCTTNDRILEALEHEYGLDHPSIITIRDIRELYKLRWTFVERIPDFVNRFPWDSRIHTTIRNTSVVTGRLAASDPNLLAQPERGTWAWAFKRGWVADNGHVVTNHDQSQIELRVLAHLSQDPVMLDVYRGNLRNPDGSKIDLHSKLVHRIFGGSTKKEEQSEENRVAAKEVNFGLPMGMQAYGLAISLRKNGLDVDEDDAQKWIDETMALYKGVPIYQAARIEEAKRTGMVRSLDGRIRYIGGITSRDEAIRHEAERFAFSTPIQAGAAVIMKVAEKAAWEDVYVPYRRQGVYCEPLLQVHDALKSEVAQGLQYEFHQRLTAAMTQAYKGLSVPLEVDGKWGENFGEMEKLK